MAVWRFPVRLTDPVLGGTGVNVWHGRTEGTVFDESTMNTISGWLEDFYTACAAVFPSTTDIDFDGYAAEVGTTEPSAVDTLDPWNVGGAGSAGSLPPANAIVVGWQTSLATRSGRGRTFLGPIASNAAGADGTIDTGALSAVRNAATALVAASTGSSVPGAALGVWSPTDSLLRDFTGTRTRDLFAVLRSRRD